MRPIRSRLVGETKETKETKDVRETKHVGESKIERPVSIHMKNVMHKLWDGIHIIAMTFNPLEMPELKYTFKCFYYSMASLLPVPQARENMIQFTKEFPIEDYISSKSKVFQWTYLLHDFINKKTESKKGISLQEARKKYEEDDITKEFWGRSIWNIIHILFKYLPEKLSREEKETVVTFIQCTQKLLPCQKCSKHMSQHMKKYNIKDYLAGNKYLFIWSNILHNTVNVSVEPQKPVIDVGDAWLLY